MIDQAGRSGAGFRLTNSKTAGMTDSRMMAIMTSPKLSLTSGMLPKKKPAIKREAIQRFPPLTLVRAIQIRLLEPGDPAIEKLRARPRPDPVVDRVAHDRRDSQQEDEKAKVDRTRSGGQGTCCEQQRVPWKKGSYDKPCLAEDDREEDEIGPSTELNDKCREVNIQVNEVADEVLNEIHWRRARAFSD